MRNIDNSAESYLDEYGFESYMVEYRQKKELEVLRTFKPKHILEIGCGINPMAWHYQDWSEYTIIEPSIEFCSHVRDHSIINSKQIELINDFFPSNKLPNIKYDMILCSSLLHEIEDPLAFLTSIRSISQKDTVIHINVPNANSFHRVLAYKMGLIDDVKQFSQRNKTFQQNSVFDLDSLNSMIDKAGLQAIDSGSYFFKPFTHDQMDKMMKHGIIDKSVLDGLYIMGQMIMGAEIFVNARLKAGNVDE